MNFNVPGSSCAEDEFRFPAGGWCSVHRSIVWDSALTWRDALSATPTKRTLLTGEVVNNIARLARFFHQAEQLVTGRKPPLESPFQVIRWWDPTDKDWSHGRRCCLRVQGLPLPAFLEALPPDQVRSIARNGDTLEAIIPRNSGRPSRLYVQALGPPRAGSPEA